MPRFSKKTIEQLKKSGWQPNRKIDCNNSLSKLKQHGFHLNPSVNGFFVEFLDLSLSLPDGRELFCFKILEINHKQCSVYRLHIEKEIYPIGLFKNGHMFLFISDDLMIYAAFDDQIYLLGDTVERGIEFICTQGMKEWKIQPL